MIKVDWLAASVSLGAAFVLVSAVGVQFANSSSQ
jgi:hypothetical protein